MTTITKNSDTSDIDEFLSSIKNPLEDSNNMFKLPEPLKPQSTPTTPQPLAEIHSPLLHNDEHIDKFASSIESVADEIILFKLRIHELETQLANLNRIHEQSLEKYSEMNVTYLENQNAELRYNLTQKVQTINELTNEIEALENMSSSANSKPSNEYETKIKTLEEQNSTLLAENLTYDVQTSEVNEQIYYREREIERLKFDLTNQRGVNDELNDQISVLQIQLANWQIDFEKEREDRTALAGDRETILKQLKNAQRRDQQLMENARARQSDCMMM